MKSSAPASARRARDLRRSALPGRRTRCSRARVSENRNVSSNTMPTARADVAASRRSRTSTPSMQHAPGVDVVEARDQPGDRRLARRRSRRRARPPRRRGSRGRGRRAPAARRRSRTSTPSNRTLARPVAAAAWRAAGRRSRGRSTSTRGCDPRAGRRARRLREQHADHPQRPDQHEDVEVERRRCRRPARLPSSTWWPPYQRIADQRERRAGSRAAA